MNSTMTDIKRMQSEQLAWEVSMEQLMCSDDGGRIITLMSADGTTVAAKYQTNHYKRD
jgi:hypothetical protein